MESFATPYLVIFNDGDKEADKGVIGIHSCLTFKRFQSMVGQKTGLPAAQLATVFVCKRTVNGAEKKQNIPINEKTNFGIILSQHNPSKERDCYFLVSLKRSKKERKASKKRAEADTAEEEAADKKDEEAVKLEEGTKCEERPGALQKADLVPPPAASVEVASTEPRQDSKPDARERAERAVPESGKDGRGSCVDHAAAPQTSAWKTGSILQRLSSGDGKAHGLLPHVEPDSVTRPQGVSHSGTQSEGLAKQEKTSGMVSPTSVLDPSQMRAPAPSVAPQHVAVGGPFLPTTAEKGGFSPFSHDFGGMDLRALVQDAMTANHLKAARWCKFCAFCRERNMASAPFHWCVDDQVVSGFRGPNPAGPIGARAMKHRVAAA